MKKMWMVVVLALILAPIPGWSSSSLSLVDSTGKYLGTLPVIPRGDEQLVPLNTLVHKAEWVLETTNRLYIVTYPGGTATFEPGNPFVACDGGFVQLRMIPQEWDGALWLPLSNVPAIFGASLEHDPRRNLIEVRMVYVEPPAPEVTPGAPDPNLPQWTLRSVIVDPGHGGKDPGAVGAGGIFEKQITLEIALKLARLLESHGIAARMTRVDDRFVSLRERARFANDERGDLFVSIHCNSARDTSIRGVETYFLKPARSERAIQAALRENSVVELENGTGSYHELTEENYILLTMATSQYIKDSETWAGTLLQEMTRSSESDARGVDQAGFYVLMGVSMPSVLVECGFLSNPEEAQTLATDPGRQKIAMGIMNSILSMKNTMEMSASR
ncbi:MAG: N-acetylmuramoyl-L-alanine amidase [bacterium]|nr:N-acetylmuramoyl-L-alanine amidase [bacterium]